jgi:hypothetical protein
MLGDLVTGLRVVRFSYEKEVESFQGQLDGFVADLKKQRYESLGDLARAIDGLYMTVRRREEAVF